MPSVYNKVKKLVRKIARKHTASFRLYKFLKLKYRMIRKIYRKCRSGAFRIKIYFLYYLKNRNLMKFRLLNKKAGKFLSRPLVSVIMPVYNVRAEYLYGAIGSVRRQIYDNWELCIVDDASTENHIRPVLEYHEKKDKRIKVRYLRKNRHIAGASNEALKMAKGDYICFIDNDDELEPDALYECVLSLQESAYDFIFSDHIMMDSKGRIVNFAYETGWNPEFFLSTNYIVHFCMYSREIINRIGLFKEGDEYKAAQDIDIKFRVMEKTQNIKFIPKPLYKWRLSKTSVSRSLTTKPYIIENSIRVANDHFEREKIKFKRIWPGLFERLKIGAFKIDFTNQSMTDIAIIIRAEDAIGAGRINDYLKLNEIESYIIKLFNGSDNNKTKEEIIIKNNNDLVTLVKSINKKYICFVNQAVMGLDIAALQELAGYLEISKDIGIAGGRVVNSKRTITGGACLFLRNLEIMYFGKKYNEYGYWFNNRLACNVSALTGQCVLTRRDIFIECGGFDFENFDNFAVIDYCLKLKNISKRAVYNPWCTVRSDKDNFLDFRSSHYKLLKRKYKMFFRNDPYYNPNFSMRRQFEF